MKRDTIKLFLTLSLFAALTAGLGGCSDCSGCGGSTETPEPELGESFDNSNDYFTFTAEVGELILGDTAYVTVDYNYQDGSQIAYTSSNPAVASIDELGKIDALSEGTTTITGSWLGKSDSIEVTVVRNGLIPELRFDYGLSTEEENSLAVDSYQLNPYIFFNGKKFYDAAITYQLSTDALGAMSGNEFVSNGTTGLVEISAKAEWRGLNNVELNKTLKLKLNNVLSLSLQDVGGAISLYTVAENGYTSSVDLTDKISVALNGEAVSFDVAVVENVARPHGLAEGASNPFTGEAVSFDGNVITALKEGTARLKVTAHTNNAELGDVDLFREITVSRPTTRIADTIALFSILDGEINGLNDIIGANATLIDAYQEGRALTVTENKILGVTSDSQVDVGSAEITFGTAEYTYECTLEVYQKILYDAEDLKSLYEGSSSTNQLKGYYYLANDIVYDENTAPVPEQGNYFAGVLDGGGNTIRGPLHIGLFGRLVGNSTVKNLAIAIDGVKTASKNSYAILSYRLDGVSNKAKINIKNFYLTFNLPESFDFYRTDGGYAIGLINFRPAYLNYENVFVDMTGIQAQLDESKIADGSITAMGVLVGYDPYGLIGGTGFTFNNVHVVWSQPALMYFNGVNWNKDKYLQIACFAQNEDQAVVDGFTFQAVTEEMRTVTKSGQTVVVPEPTPQKTVYKGLYRHSDYESAKAFFAAEENAQLLATFAAFADVSEGYPKIAD